MPNRLQVGFLVSFFLTLFSLIFLARWAKLRLKAAGYDISELILIGLPREPVEHVVDQAQSSLFQTMSDWALPELLALLLAFGTSVFIYVKFAFSKISTSNGCDASSFLFLMSVSQNASPFWIRRHGKSSPW